MGHLIQDAQEVLVGLAGAAVSGAAIGSYIYKIKKIHHLEKQQAVIGGLAASLGCRICILPYNKKLKGVIYNGTSTNNLCSSSNYSPSISH